MPCLTTVTHQIVNKKSQSNLGTAASLPLMAENNYATDPHWLQWDAEYLFPKLSFPSEDLHPSTNPSLTTPDSISRFATVHPPDRQTDRPTGGLVDVSIPTPAHEALLIT